MAKRERNKSQRRRRRRVESTVQLDEEYAEATKKAEAEGPPEAKSKPTPQTTKKEPEEPDWVEKIEPDAGGKTFGPNNAGWVAVEITEDNQQAAVTALHFGDKKVKAQLFVDALRDQFKLVHGLKKQALKELISQARKEYVVRENIVVAEATAATPGKDGSVKLEFQEGLDEDTRPLVFGAQPGVEGDGTGSCARIGHLEHARLSRSEARELGAAHRRKTSHRRFRYPKTSTRCGCETFVRRKRENGGGGVRLRDIRLRLLAQGRNFGEATHLDRP